MTDLERWLQVAGRAPSAHNTQPWSPRVVGDRIELAVVPDRVLWAGDPSFRDLILSLGAWVESLAVAAAEDGRALTVEPTPWFDRLGELPVTGPADPARPVLVVGHAPGAGDDTFTSDDVRDRRVHRGRLTAGPDVLSAAPDLPDWLRVQEVDGAAFAALVRLGTTYTASRPSIARELLTWLRLDPAHPRYHRDGMTDVMLGLPSVAARLLAPVTRRPALRARVLGVVGALARTVENLGRGRPLPPAAPPAPDEPRHLALVADTRSLGVTGVLSTTELMDSRIGMSHAHALAAGRALQRLWLRAHRAGMCVAPHSEVIDSPHAHAALRGRLRLRRADVVLAVFSVGRPAGPVARSPRLGDLGG